MQGGPVITFSSDFGLREYYVGAVKGAILSACPEARVVDISHSIGSHDVFEAAFTLFGAYSSFPGRTIHLIVVDPGVGSSRRSIIAQTDKYFFVGPDNGVFSLIYEREEVSRVFSISAQHHFRHPVSPTFHGRDIMAPVAGSLARGITPDSFGESITDYVRLKMPLPRKIAEKTCEGIILHIDKFGNIITNLSPAQLEELLGSDAQPQRFLVGEKEITNHVRYYAEAGEAPLFSLIGSSGFYEIAALKKPAARILQAKRGDQVRFEAQ